jgi:hypothetical protein
MVFVLAMCACFFATPCMAADEKKSDKNDQLLTRIDFGNSYITGQTLKSGAVYLLQRKKNEIKSMLKYRENYRREIIDAYNLSETAKNKKIE